jgi:CRISPR-associated protein Csd2
MSQSDVLNIRAAGLLVIEVINSNPNGDPDRESDPRLRPDERGEISPVSFKRKLRDLVQEKKGPVWQSLAKRLELSSEGFEILETRGRNRSEVQKEISEERFSGKYWDARIFGNTFLEEGLENSIRTGVVQFGLGISVAPIAVERLTTTNKAGVEADKDRGMAPLAYRVVSHGVYCMPFFVNPSAALKTGCTVSDVRLLLSVIPFAYSHTASYIRSAVELRHAWYIEHTSPLGSASDFEMIAALTPRKNANPDEPSRSWGEYEVPTALPEGLAKKVKPLRDLVAEAYASAGA